MHLKTLLIALLLSSGLINNVFAAAYKCTIESTYYKKGTFINKQELGSGGEFVIDRDNGRRYGYMNLPYRFEVLHRGDDETSFRALINDGKQGVDYISIREYADSRKKPFIYFSEFIGTQIMTGTCVDY